LSSSELYLSTLSAELVGQYSVGARGSGCLGAVGVPDGSCASWSGSSLLVDGHAHARPPQSGHLFHDSSFVFVSLRGLFLALFPATEWSCFSLPCCMWCGAVRVSSGSLVSDSESSLLCGHAHALSPQSGH